MFTRYSCHNCTWKSVLPLQTAAISTVASVGLCTLTLSLILTFLHSQKFCLLFYQSCYSEKHVSRFCSTFKFINKMENHVLCESPCITCSHHLFHKSDQMSAWYHSVSNDQTFVLPTKSYSSTVWSVWYDEKSKTLKRLDSDTDSESG